MTLSLTTIILLGCIGGLLPDVLRAIQNRYKKRFSKVWTEPQFLLGLVLQIAVGGLAAYLFDALNAKQAIACGFAGPELLSKLAATKGTADGAGQKGADERDRDRDVTKGIPAVVPPKKFRLREWWSL